VAISLILPQKGGEENAGGRPGAAKTWRKKKGKAKVRPLDIGNVRAGGEEGGSAKSWRPCKRRVSINAGSRKKKGRGKRERRANKGRTG